VIVSVRRLWSLKLSEGQEVIANLFYNSGEDDATLEITVRAAHCEDVTATEIATQLKNVLAEQGATEMAMREGQ
jgi:hypothetical protein